MRANRFLASTCLTLVMVCGSAASAQLRPTVVVERARDGSTALVWEGRSVHTTTRRVQDPRAIRLASGEVILTWTEAWAGGSASMYAVAMNGRDFGRVRETTYTVRLRYANFDPLKGGEPFVHPALAGAASDDMYIVQFVCPPLEAFRREIAGLGGEVFKFLADHSHLVRLSAAEAEAVSTLPYVRWVGRYHPAYKLDPALHDALVSGQEGQLEDQRYSIMFAERGPAMQTQVAARLAAMGGIVHGSEPQGFRIEATLSAAQLVALSHMSELVYVDPKGEPEADMDIARAISGGDYAHGLGYDGTGVRGEVCDTGVRVTHVDFQHHPPIVHGANSSDTGHGTSVYGIVFGDGTANALRKGMLPKAQGLVAAFSPLGLLGGGANRYTHTAELVDPTKPFQAVFQTNSWGDPQVNNYTTISAQMDDIIFLNDILITQSQSNTGSTLSRPQAWSKNIVSVGAVNHQGTLTKADDAWGGASIGPAEDGRLKPDLAHFYDQTDTTSSGCDTCYGSFGGTSGATPITVGHFGIMFQMWKDGIFGNDVTGGTVFEERPHSTTAKAIMVNSASQYPFTGTTANLSRYKQGWGMPDVKSLHELREKMVVWDEEDPILPFEVKEYQVEVASGEPAFRATLVYVDRMGTVSSNQHRINDLSLKVIAPNGTEYWGNNGLAAGNWSTAGGSSNVKDTVENVFVQNPQAGTWTVQVYGDEIVQDTHTETPGIDADFALVVSGATGGKVPPPLKIQLPAGTPQKSPPHAAIEFPVKIIAGTENVVPGSEKLFFAYDGGSFQEASLTHVSGEDYLASVPAAGCAQPRYYIQAEGDLGTVIRNPSTAPANAHATKVGEFQVLIDENFESDAGFTVFNDPSLTDGAWERGVPAGFGDRNDPLFDADGSGACWLTANRPGNSDIDGGPTILTSPVYDLSAASEVVVSYARWHKSNTFEDPFRTEVSNDGGATWKLVSSVNPSNTDWTVASFNLIDFVPPTDKVRVRFIVTDNPNNSIIESGVDRFRVEGFACIIKCYADCELDGDLDIFDFLCFQGKFADGDPYADCEKDGDHDIFDFLCFQGLYSSGC